MPADLDALHERFVVRACELLGFESAEKPGARSFYFELGGNAIVDSLPGVPGGTRFLGTFDREEAVVREELEYFASGIPSSRGSWPSSRTDRAGGRRCWSCPVRGGPASGCSASWPATADRGAGHRPRRAARPDWARLIVKKRDALRGLPREDWERELPDGLDWPAFLASAPGPEAPRLLAIAGFRLAL